MLLKNQKLKDRLALIKLSPTFRNICVFICFFFSSRSRLFSICRISSGILILIYNADASNFRLKFTILKASIFYRVTFCSYHILHNHFDWCQVMFFNKCPLSFNDEFRKNRRHVNISVVFFFFFFLAAGVCMILVTLPGIEPMSAALGAWSLNH